MASAPDPSVYDPYAREVYPDNSGARRYEYWRPACITRTGQHEFVNESTVCFRCSLVKNDSLFQSKALQSASKRKGSPSSRIRILFAEQEGRCFYCQKSLTLARTVDGRQYHDSATLEHVIPLSRGGSNALENTCAACARCNANKGDLLLTEWLEKLREGRRHCARITRDERLKLIERLEIMLGA